MRRKRETRARNERREGARERLGAQWRSHCFHSYSSVLSLLSPSPLFSLLFSLIILLLYLPSLSHSFCLSFHPCLFPLSLLSLVSDRLFLVSATRSGSLCLAAFCLSALSLSVLPSLASLQRCAQDISLLHHIHTQRQDTATGRESRFFMSARIHRRFKYHNAISAVGCHLNQPKRVSAAWE